MRAHKLTDIPERACVGARDAAATVYDLLALPLPAA